MNTAIEPAAVERSPEPRARDRRATQRRAVRFFEAYALVLLTIAVGLFFTFWSKTSDTFLTAANLQTTLSGQSAVAVIAIGALLPVVCNEWDLSVGAQAGLVAVLAAEAVNGGTSLALAILLGVVVGMLVGALNATIVTRLHVNAVIATLGVATALEGAIAQRSAGAAVATNLPRGFQDFGTETWLGIPRTTFLVLAIALVVYYLLQHTPYGRQLYALGTNAAAARLVGLRTRLLLASTFVLAGLLAAIGGVIQLAHAGSADPKVGPTFTLPALAAAFLSAASIKPGRYNVGGALVAILFLAILNSGLNLAGAQPYVSSYVNGGALVIGVALAAYFGRARAGQRA